MGSEPRPSRYSNRPHRPTKNSEGEPCSPSERLTWVKSRLPRQSLIPSALRVRPETLCRITEFSEHESNGRELDEGERVAVEVLPVLGQSAAAVEPGDGAFDHPTPGLDDEALHPIGSLDDLGLEIGQDAGQGAVKDRPLIGAVGEQFPEKGKTDRTRSPAARDRRRDPERWRR